MLKCVAPTNRENRSATMAAIRSRRKNSLESMDRERTRVGGLGSLENREESGAGLRAALGCEGVLIIQGDAAVDRAISEQELLER
jgi:hypothetical protein